MSAACIATWAFGMTAVKTCKEELLKYESALDSVQAGITDVEDRLDHGCYIVGRGGMPNSDGELELDAALMDGSTAKFGAVAGLQGVACAVPVARLVMDKSSHNILVGRGAQEFAHQHNVLMEPQEQLLGKESMENYQKFLKEPKSAEKEGHDTLGLIAVDSHGHMAVGVATSGMPYKSPGRVGDSPLPGAGLYADGRYGAACCTGDGDNILRFSPSSRVVALLETLHPTEACRRVVDDIADVWKRVQPDAPLLEIGIIAMNTKGEYGAAGTISSWRDVRNGKEYPGFPFAVWMQADNQAPQGRVEIASPQEQHMRREKRE